jgi:hypothetical protein
MARKRGGIAGFYDRNKKIIKTVAPIAAGFIPGVGPLIGAGIGAALGGDTEGKGYFKGFNTGGALMGGASGYAGAKLGQAAKGGLGKMFTGGMSPVDKLTGAPKVGLTPTVAPSVAPSVASGGVPSSYKIGQAIGTGTAKGYKFIKENEDILGKIAGGIQATRSADLADEQARLKLAEEGRWFDEQQKLRVRQQANLDQDAAMTKQQFDELNATRAKLRALLTGGM